MILAALCASYLCGAIPTGLLIGRLKGVDVRQQGSGNVGATNVARVAGKLPGFFVLIIDTLKGWLPTVYFSSWVLHSGTSILPEIVRLLIGLAAVAGHIWNPFLGMKGGKGVATSLGLLWALSPLVGMGVFAVWMAVFLLTRYVSLASISAAFAAPFLVAFLGLPTSWVLGAIGVSVAIVGRHRPNILRLLQGEEHRLSRR